MAARSLKMTMLLSLVSAATAFTIPAAGVGGMRRAAPAMRRCERVQRTKTPYMGVGAPGGETAPLGIAFEEIDDGNGAIVVGFTEKSNGAKFGVNVGETLIACSATSLKAGKEGAFTNTGYGGRPFDNWSVVMFPCEGTPFDQILAALRSNNPRWGISEISLVLRPPGPGLEYKSCGCAASSSSQLRAT